MYLLLITAEPCGGEDRVAGLLGTYSYQSSTIKVTRGDYAPLMQRMIENLEKAKVRFLPVLHYTTHTHTHSLVPQAPPSFSMLHAEN